MVRNVGKKTFLKCQYEIAISIFLGLFWSILPLIGWSRYTTEGIPHCSIEFSDRSFNVVSYNVTVFIFLFLLPFGIIFITSYKILALVRTLYLEYIFKFNFINHIFFNLGKSSGQKIQQFKNKTFKREKANYEFGHICRYVIYK